MKTLWRLYKLIENFWFEKIPQKLRYLLVGGFNTVFAYGCFLALLMLLPYNAALIVQYVVTVNVSIFTMRYYVFQSRGNFKAEYLKAWSVYVGIFFFNAAALNFLVIYCRLIPAVAQAVYLTVSTVLTFLLHKYYSFRKTGNDTTA